jgi:hypothetical protein
LKATFPITFAHCFNTSVCKPVYEFMLNATKQYASDCRVTLTSDSLTTELIRVDPVAVNIIKRDIVGRISVKKVPTAFQTIFDGYEIQNILVQIVDPYPQPHCTSDGDPNIRPFNRADRYTVLLNGDFWLLKAKSSQNAQTEIQVRHVQCSWVGMGCNCGVIVREGNNILGINCCDNLLVCRIIRYLSDATAPSGTITEDTHSNAWTINMLSGVKIIATAWPDNVYGKATRLNIGVYGVSYEAYDGLCSPDATSATAEGSRVPDEKSFFRFSSANPPVCLPLRQQIPSCTCNGNANLDSEKRIVCNQSLAELLQTESVLQAGYECTPLNQYKKRAASVSGVDTISLDLLSESIDHSKDTFTPKDYKWPTPSGITQDQASAKCKEVLRRSKSTIDCSAEFDSVILPCVSDIKVYDNLTGAGIDSYTFTFERQCVATMKQSLTETDEGIIGANSKVLATFKRVNSSICPSSCNYKGICTDSKCSCYKGIQLINVLTIL